MGRFNWLGTYTNRSHLAFDEVGAIWRDNPGIGDVVARDLEPAVLQGAVLHAGLHLHRDAARHRCSASSSRSAVNAIPALLKGPVIFFSLLPMIVTPLIGSLMLFWMIDSQGVIGATLQIDLQRPAAVAEGLADADLGDALRLRRLAPTRPSASSSSTPACRPCPRTRSNRR